MSELVSMLSQYPNDGLHGRRKVHTYKRAIIPENVAEVVNEALQIHTLNRHEYQYLYDFYRGRQDIRLRVKTVRPEIANKITVNHANEIVTFKTAYLLAEPIQYVSIGNSDEISDAVQQLNDYMRMEAKDARDKELADWIHICGVGVRMVLPEIGGYDSAPFRLYTLDPRDAFCIYASGLGERKLAGVLRQRDENGDWYSCVYTDTHYFEIKGTEVSVNKRHALGQIPIFEYVAANSRMGAFECVIPLLNAINTVESNRVDDIEQIVQSFLVFENCAITAEQFAELRHDGGLIVKGEPQLPAKVYSIKNELGQAGTQTVIDDLYQKILTICGMPNRNGGSSTSDTGVAVTYRDGFVEAENRAKSTEKAWLRSETEFLQLILRICRDTPGGIDIDTRDVKVEFTRKNQTDIQSKTQVLIQLLSNSMVHPKYAYQASGLFADMEEAYKAGMEWRDEQAAADERAIKEAMADECGVQTGGQSDSAAEQEGDTTV